MGKFVNPKIHPERLDAFAQELALKLLSHPKLQNMADNEVDYVLEKVMLEKVMLELIRRQKNDPEIDYVMAVTEIDQNEAKGKPPLITEMPSPKESNKSFKCNACAETFISKPRLIEHKYSEHGDGKPFEYEKIASKPAYGLNFE